MRRAARMAPIAGILGIVASGCAAPMIEHGVFRGPAGYHVTLPADGWDVVRDARADLELRRRDGDAAMLVNSVCGDTAVRRPLAALGRELLVGLRDRDVKVDDGTTVDGRDAAHVVVDGRAEPDGQPTGVEAYVTKGGGCVYDLVYAAPMAEFEHHRSDFQRLVSTFRFP